MIRMFEAGDNPLPVPVSRIPCTSRAHPDSLDSSMPGAFRRTAGLVLACLLVAAHARAQIVFESVGERALGMGGAFVAVADDATAVYWNPAGLGTKLGAGMTIGWYRFQTGNQAQPPTPGPLIRSGNFTSLGTTPAGLSYGHFHVTRLTTDAATGVLTVDTVTVSQYGMTVLQTVAPGLIVGSTLKYLRGDVIETPVTATTVSDALDETSHLSGPSHG